MAIQYLLPCPDCGQNLKVELSQAGETVGCACGRGVDVPTMRGLRQLPIVEETRAAAEAEAQAQSRQWGPRQGLILIGALILLAGLAAAVYFMRTYPEPAYTRDEVAEITSQQIQDSPLTKTWIYWKDLEENGITAAPTPPELDFAERVALANQRLAIAFGVAGIGLLLVLGGTIATLARAK